MDSVAKIYAKHNLEMRGRGFLILGNERKQLLKKYIQGSNLKICDLGSRDGALSKEYMEGNELWVVDFDRTALDALENKDKIKTVYQDLNAEKWDLPENYFDVVIFSEVLEHLYYPERVLKKISKILKQDSGILLGTVPNAFSFKNRLRLLFAKKKATTLEDPTHINHFEYKELKNILKNNFKNIEVSPLIQKKYKFLSKISPSLFSFMLFFKAKNK
jgi:2-polyprenyl-3-methyl-5-hydroxy-6-metoxy-1,4-benzoquinol methylase